MILDRALWRLSLPLCLFSLAAACSPSLSQLRRALPPPEASVDVALFDADRPGQIAAAERLCHPLADAPQRALGFELARRAHVALPDDPETALLLSSCAYLLGEAEMDPARLALITDIGIDAAQAAGSSQAGDCLGHDAQAKAAAESNGQMRACTPEVARAAYRHALLIGLRMRVAGMSEALQLLDQELALLDVARLAAEEEQGGPLRVLAMIYLKAPGWPAGPGDLDLALALLQEAVERFPTHPLNRIFLAAALLEDGDEERAKAELEIGLELADEALWGEMARSWRDMEALTGGK
ncbi:MAG: hypothetical protein LBM75_08540 [Myxococcales bacterium]|nr:hypothetical protein [Myxococcales bacterium]